MGRWSVLAFTIALLAIVPGNALRAQGADDRFARPPPNVERQIDRLERGGSVDSLTRRRLQDQLRRQSPGRERSAAERTLGRLPAAGTLPETAVTVMPESDPLPSSLTPGLSGRSGGPGLSGHQVPPGGRSGAVR